MEQYYIKSGSKYIPCGFSGPDCHMEGLYFKQFTKHGSQSVSILYYLGNPTNSEENIPLLLDIMKHEDKITSWLGRFIEENPKINIYGISIHDLSIRILRELYKEIKNEINR